MSGEYYHTWKGVAGTQTWDIGRTDFALNIMFSITYDQNLHGNWLAVGIQPKDSVTNFYTMYNEDEEGFDRKEWPNCENPTKHDNVDAKLRVSAYCVDQSYTPEIRVKLEDLQC